MEEKLDELIGLIKLQNTAWEHCLNMLNGIATMMNEKNNAEAQLLKEHPPIRQPAAAPGNTAAPPAPPPPRRTRKFFFKAEYCIGTVILTFVETWSHTISAYM